VLRSASVPVSSHNDGRAVSSAVERFVYTEDVGSSILSPPTIVSEMKRTGAAAAAGMRAFPGLVRMVLANPACVLAN
jgi:hypothetical protein